MKIGALIPAYNAEKNIISVINELEKYFGQLIIVVNDGSTDNTLKLISQKNITVLSHKQNRGKGEALKTGFQKSLILKWDAVITIDADGQHNPKLVPLFIAALNKSDNDIIIGSRMRDIRTMPFHRIFSNKITSQFVAWRVKQKILDSQSGYRIIKTEVLKNVSLKTSHYDTETELILRASLRGYKIGFIDIDTIYNEAPSSIRLLLDTWRFIKLYLSSFFWKTL